MNHYFVSKVGFMSDLLKSKDIQELFNLSASQLFQYRDTFNIEVIERLEGKKKIYYYHPESIEIIRQIVELKKLGHSSEVIKDKLNLNRDFVIQESFKTQSVDNSLMIVESKIDNLSNGLESTIEMFYKQFADTKNLQESLINHSQDVGKYQAESIEKDKLIHEIKMSNDLNINQINIIHKLEIESFINQIEVLKSELESKNIEIERLKNKSWWKK